MDIKIITAAMIVIGNEILSGRTQDLNIHYLAQQLTKNGIVLREVQIIPDQTEAIITAVNTLRTRHHYLFTSGGIGPTHDDITAPAIAQALNLPCIFDQEAEKILAEYYQTHNLPFTVARRQMTRMPQGAHHICNPISVAPGFVIENIFVMAGVPQIFQAMLQNVLPQLEKGTEILSETVLCPFPESLFSEQLAQIQSKYPDISIGSYPQTSPKQTTHFLTEIVLSGAQSQHFHEALKKVKEMVTILQESEA